MKGTILLLTERRDSVPEGLWNTNEARVPARQGQFYIHVGDMEFWPDGSETVKSRADRNDPEAKRVKYRIVPGSWMEEG